MKTDRVPGCEDELPTTKMTATLRREILATVNRKIVRKRRVVQPKEPAVELDAANLEEVKESGIRVAAKPPPLPASPQSRAPRSSSSEPAVAPPRRPSLAAVSVPPPLPRRPSLSGVSLAPPPVTRPSLPAVSVPPPLPSRPSIVPDAQPQTRRSRPSLPAAASSPPVGQPQDEEIPVSVAPMAERRPSLVQPQSPAVGLSPFLRHRLAIILGAVTFVFAALLAAAAALSGAAP